jgi:hypothetical protein
MSSIISEEDMESSYFYNSSMAWVPCLKSKSVRRIEPFISEAGRFIPDPSKFDLLVTGWQSEAIVHAANLDILFLSSPCPFIPE